MNGYNSLSQTNIRAFRIDGCLIDKFLFDLHLFACMTQITYQIKVYFDKYIRVLFSISLGQVTCFVAIEMYFKSYRKGIKNYKGNISGKKNNFHC